MVLEVLSTLDGPYWNKETSRRKIVREWKEEDMWMWHSALQGWRIEAVIYLTWEGW
jgi:hypothetical protein